jgi:hypothetical protein
VGHIYLFSIPATAYQSTFLHPAAPLTLVHLLAQWWEMLVVVVLVVVVWNHKERI